MLILGGGPIGLGVIKTLKAQGAEKIIVSEMAPRRKEFARQFGADYVLDPSKDDVVARVKEICDGQGAHVAFDAAGVQAGFHQAMEAIRPRGTVVNIAVWKDVAAVNMNWLNFREKTYMGIATYVEGDFQEVIDAIASGELRHTTNCARKLTQSVKGALEPQPMITGKIKMDEVEEKGFKALIHDKENHVKVLVKVHPEADSTSEPFKVKYRL